MADERLKAWLRQARADWKAGQADGVDPCHRRYWLQQACEKGIKALGLILWKGHPSEEGRLRQHFLRYHSPLLKLGDSVLADPDLPRSLKFLLRQLETEVSKLDGADIIKRVDATTPSMEPSEVSYRYPFIDGDAKDVAPVDWTETDWDTYQGNAIGVTKAIERFLEVVENQRKLAARANR